MAEGIPPLGNVVLEAGGEIPGDDQSGYHQEIPLDRVSKQSLMFHEGHLMNTNRKVIIGIAVTLAASTLLLLWWWTWRDPGNQGDPVAQQRTNDHVPIAGSSPAPPAGENAGSPELVSDIARKTVEADVRRGVDALKRAEWKRRMRDPLQFIEEGWMQGLPYKEATELVDPNQVPRLIKALEDPARAAQWTRIAVLLGYLGKDAESARAILKYVRRAEDWQSLDHDTMFFRCVLKVQILQWGGMAGDKAVIAELKEALTPEGAAALIKDWSGGPLPDWAKQGNNLISQLQTGAAIGLVLSEDPEGVRRVEQLYAQVHSRIKSDKSVAKLHSGMVSALAIRDVIAEIGKQEYLNTVGNQELEKLRPHLAKYR